MLKFLNSTLTQFRSCFSRYAAFEWFVVTVIGRMVRTDHLGVTSIIRDLSLRSHVYENMIHFFHSKAWKLESRQSTWARIVCRTAPLVTIYERIVLVGDGMNQSKEARRMPGVKKMHPDSENSSKGEYIFGHWFGAMGLLIGSSPKWFCLPLSMPLQAGIQTIFGWDASSPAQRQDSHVVQLIDQAFMAAEACGRHADLVRDRYFLSIPALERLAQRNQPESAHLHIVTKAKSNAAAYERPPARTGRRGRPPKKGAMVKRRELFSTRAHDFQTAEVTLYGKKETVTFLCLNLLWGQGLYQELRFVLVVRDKYPPAILVSTDLRLEAATIIELYGWRFKIECMFREMKQVIGAFDYPFWSKSMPKLKRYLKKEEVDPIEQGEGEKERQRIRATIDAIEGFVMCGCIATGLVQLIALRFSHTVPALFSRYLRTPSKSIVSEATVTAYLRKSIFRLFARNPHAAITRIIHSKQTEPNDDADLLAS